MTKTKSLHIGIDGNEANVANRVGSNRYAYHILKALKEKAQEERLTVYLKTSPLPDMPEATKNFRYKILRPGKLWTQWRLPLGLKFAFKQPDVFFSPGHYAPRFSPVPTVVSVMDLAFLKFPNLFLKYETGYKQLKDWTEYSVRQASHIIAISESTKRDIEEIYAIKQENITVAYPGIDQSFYQPASQAQIKKMRQAYDLPEKFILYLGTLQPRKNLTRLLKAFEKLPSKFSDYHLVFAGKKGWLYEGLLQAIKDSPKRDKVKRIGYVAQKDLPALYTAASCLCLVGLYEGFGMPPAEALSCGTIPVVSDNSSLPEVVGEAGITVDPYSVTSIRHGIITAISEPQSKRHERLQLAQVHLKQFDWHRAAEKIMEALHAITL